MTSARHVLTSVQQHIPAAPYGLLATLYDMTAARHDVTAARHDVTAARYDLTAARYDVTAACYDMTAARHDLTAGRDSLNGAREDLTGAGRLGLLVGFFVDADAATLLNDQRAVAIRNQQLGRQEVGIYSWTVDVLLAARKRMQRQSGQRDDRTCGQI